MTGEFLRRRLLTVVLVATAMIAASAANAQTYTDWYGGGVLTSTSNCPNGLLDQHVNRVFTVRYLPAGVGMNGTKSSISILSQHYAQGYAIDGSFTSALQVVSAQTIARFPGPSGYPVKLAVTKQTPATITDTTPMIALTLKITGYSGFPGNNNCTAMVNATVFRP